MSLTAFVAITSALVDLLSADTPLSANISRARDRQLAEQFEDAINVQFDGATPTPGAILGAPIDWQSRFTIDLYKRTTTTTADLAVDPMMLGVFGRIAAAGTLGGLVDDIWPPVIEAEYTAEQQRTGWIRMTYPIFHRTYNHTLEQP